MTNSLIAIAHLEYWFAGISVVAVILDRIFYRGHAKRPQTHK